MKYREQHWGQEAPQGISTFIPSSSASKAALAIPRFWYTCSSSRPSRTQSRHWWTHTYCCSVCTIHTLSFLRSWTMEKMSNVSRSLISCRRRSSTMNVPDRPTPALQWTSIGPHSLIIWSLTMRTNLIKLWGRSGTPKSGQAVKWKCLMGRVTLP